MVVKLTDEVLKDLRLNAPQTLIELACRLYAADQLMRPDAARLAGLQSSEFELELSRRGLPWMRVNYDATHVQEFDELRADLGLAAKRSDK